MSKKLSALALLVAVSLSGCAAQHTATTAPAADAPKSAAPAQTNVVKRDLADGLYEMVMSPKGDALYVASSEGFKDVQGGVVYKLDPATLKTIGRSHTDLKNFALAISEDGQTHRRWQSETAPAVHRAQQRGLPVRRAPGAAA